jgi:Na+/melibiose symporter-like transporter
MEKLILLSLLWIVCGCLGAWITGRRGRSSLSGFVLGVLFGPLGLMIALFLPQGVVPDTVPGEEKRSFEDIATWHRHRLRSKVESRRRAQQRIAD